MVSKCANPNCSAAFHYLKDGKVFQLQVKSPRRARHLELFWLCGPCARSMTLLVDDGRVVTVPLKHEPLRRAAAS